MEFFSKEFYKPPFKIARITTIGIKIIFNIPPPPFLAALSSSFRIDCIIQGLAFEDEENEDDVD